MSTRHSRTGAITDHPSNAETASPEILGAHRNPRKMCPQPVFGLSFIFFLMTPGRKRMFYQADLCT